MKHLFHAFLIILVLAACKQSKPVATDEELQMAGPVFNADSALAFCAAQCAFGPRTMNSDAHEQCAQWIIQRFEQYGCKVTTQRADLKGWDGKVLHSTNIIAQINPEAQQRIIICAHWDSRPWADNDPDSANWHKPVMAANDAASGVGVMLELARLINGNDTTATDSMAGNNALAIGIDLVCFDAEDYGAPDWSGLTETEDTWALGAQYYASNLAALYPNGNQPQHGILLDMVGGQGARFYQEGLSLHYAQNIVNLVWQSAATAGYGSFFPNERGGTITDDHKPLNEAGIPTIDIIPYYPDCEQSSFGPTWHTVSDDMQHLDKNVLKAVGQTIIQYLYSVMN